MNGVDVGCIVIGLLMLLGVFEYVGWKIEDKQRRLERLKDRGLA